MAPELRETATDLIKKDPERAARAGIKTTDTIDEALVKLQPFVAAQDKIELEKIQADLARTRSLITRTSGGTGTIANVLNEAANDLRATTGSDGFVNTAAYQEYRNRFIQANPGKAKDFDSHMRNLGINLNPSDPTAQELIGLVQETISGREL